MYVKALTIVPSIVNTVTFYSYYYFLIIYIDHNLS